MAIMGTFVAAVVLLSVLTVARAGFEDLLSKNGGDLIKGGIKKATGADLCDVKHLGAGVPFCPMPGMSQDRAFCCLKFISGVPDCCNWVENNMKTIAIVAGVILGLALLACCGCCYCCCCRQRNQPSGVIVMHQQPGPTGYPNHPHQRLNTPT